MMSHTARDCYRAIFTYREAIALGFRFVTDGDRALWFDWPPDLSPVVLGPMRHAIERNVPHIIALIAISGEKPGAANAEPAAPSRH